MEMGFQNRFTDMNSNFEFSPTQTSIRLFFVHQAETFVKSPLSSPPQSQDSWSNIYVQY